jgi:hypothetical protein
MDGGLALAGGWVMREVYPNRVTCFPEEISPAYCALVPAERDVNVCEGVGLYVPRNPAESILYRVVAAELENFLERQRLRDRHVPRFVERELRSFLDCGILARGFLRVHCDACRFDRLVAFSCYPQRETICSSNCASDGELHDQGASRG